MKKSYEAPEWELITFNAEDLRTADSCKSDSGCPDDCTHCFYLVCAPEDVIIGK